jgi:hypothetical protein
VAAFVSEMFALNLHWLAEGRPPMESHVPLPPKISSLIDANEPFLRAYERSLRSHLNSYCHVVQDIEDLRAALNAVAAGSSPKPMMPRTAAGSRSAWMLPREWIPAQRLRVAHLRAMVKVLAEKANDIEAVIKDSEALHASGQSEGGMAAEQREREKDLTDISSSIKSVGDVKIPSQWPELKRRLQKATSAVGAKPALARMLGVDLTQISQWLRAGSAREPGGDYALRLLKWVERAEQKNK